MNLIWNIGRAFTSTSRGVIEDAAIVIGDGSIEWVGPRRDLPPELSRVVDIVDADGGLLTPGLVDAHTHPVYAGSRLEEIALRSSGASYSEIAASGGGIGSTVAATRATPMTELREIVHGRLRAWLRSGTTTVEAKTGYHLERDGEVASVAMLAELSQSSDVPRVIPTFLPAHAMPPDGGSSPDEYVDEASTWCNDAVAAGAVFCDVFCDEGYFTVDQSRRFLAAGRDAGLAVRLHADELARTGGSQLAAEIGAASADHLLEADATDAHALAQAGVAATLAPATALSMGKIPPIEAFRSAGVTIALGTDHNPGTSGLNDMTVAISLAISAFHLSVEQALAAATAGGARSLRRDDIGRIEPGARADLVQWDADHEGVFAWSYGVAPVRVWRDGHRLG